MNILVTGATGFIGKALIARLEKEGYSIIPFSLSSGNDVCNFKDFIPFLDYKIGTLFHLAGKTFVPDSWKNPADFYQVNTSGTYNTLEFCRQSGAKMIYISAYVYGAPRYFPIDEKHPVNPSNPYAHSKWLGELACRFYSEYFKVPAVVIRPFNLYGHGQPDHFLVPMLINQLKNTGKITVKDASPKRDFLHISDFVEACLTAMKCKDKLQIYNAGFGDSVSVKDLIQMIINLSGKNIPWNDLHEIRKDEILNTVSSCKLTIEGLWKPQVSLKEGIVELLSKEMVV